MNLVTNDVRNIRNLKKTNNELIKLFIVDEITQICTSLKNNKSSGLDSISYEHIKYGGKTLYQHLCNLFNIYIVLMSLCTLSDWKKSVLILLFKGGTKEKSNQNSYRGIEKVFEKAVYARLGPLQNNFPHPTQMAYQKELSSLHASFNIQELSVIIVKGIVT